MTRDSNGKQIYTSCLSKSVQNKPVMHPKAYKKNSRCASNEKCHHAALKKLETIQACPHVPICITINHKKLAAGGIAKVA
jgi:hypothetical protein